MNPLADLRSAWNLWQILRRERPDVLHTHNPKPGLYGRVVGRLAGVPLVVNTVHGLYATPDDPLPKRFLVYGLEAVASRFSDVELVQSKEDLALLTKWRISAPSKTRWLGNGVDLERFDPNRFTDEDRCRVRQELSLPEETRLIGTVGRLVAEKGYPELFEAAEHLKDRMALICIGPHDPDKHDALSPDLLARAEAAGVRFLGMRQDVDRLYAAMDIFALASHREGFPRAAMEAAAMGLPIVATDIRGCREVVEHGRNGLLVPVRRPDALTDSVRALVDSPQLRKDMGTRGREKALAEFDERRIVRTVLAAYRGDQPAPWATEGSRSKVSGFRYRVLKRVFDLVVAAGLLIVLAPLLALIAVLVRVRLGHPVFFQQQRPGLHGEIFTLVKFRTMTDATDEKGVPLPDSERMTRLGRILRALSLDELPELLNVLRGEMSIVGPRPLLPRYLARFNPRQDRRHEVKPGLTGWAQVNGRNEMSWEEKLEMDVWYVDHWSLSLDLRICLKTVAAVVRRTGVNQPGEATASEFMGSNRGEVEK